MDRDEVEDVGISVEGSTDSEIIKTAEELLEKVGNKVGSFSQLDKTAPLMFFSQVAGLCWILSGRRFPSSCK